MSELLAPYATQQFTDNNGLLLNGGKLFTYAAGTTTKLATFTDSTGATANQNPIILNARGECNIWIPPGTAYKFVLSPSTDTDPPTNPFWTVDNITTGLAQIPFGTDTGTANAYAVTGVNGIGALTAGDAIVLKIGHSNTGASTLNVNALGIKSIVDQLGNALVSGALTAGNSYLFIYNGTAWNYSYFNNSITLNPSITVSPTGNPTATLSSFNVTGNAISGTEREFLVNIGFTSAVGGTNAADKVALYTGMVGNSGTHDIWSQNPVVIQSASSGSYNCQCIEADTNNNNADRGNAAGSSALAAPITNGISITGAGTNKCTTGLLISGTESGAGTVPMWNRGITLAGNSVAQFGIQDFNVCTSVVQALGSYSITVDLSQAVASAAAIAIPNGSPITGFRVGSSTVFDPIIEYNGTAVYVGNGQGAVIANQQLMPVTDNTFALGGASNRWSVVYSATGTINTSDPSLKTDIAPLPSALPIVAAINPITYKWITGGYDSTETTETQTVHATETAEEEEEQITHADGKATAAMVKVQRQKPLWDDIPVIDPATGQPVMVWTKAQPAVLDADGEELSPDIPARQIPRTHRVPRMVQQPVTVMKPVARAGARTHWGFDALNVKAATDAAGRDFAGYVKMADGTSALRHDQLIPILWKAVQEQQAQIEALRAEIDALKPH